MRLASIASGSSGNCIYMGSDNTHILVDVGISNKRIESGLLDLGVGASEVNGILITHEHSDHISGLGVFSRKHNVPIYATEGTIREIRKNKSLGEYDAGLFNIIRADEDFNIGDIKVSPFATSHDAVSSCGYRLNHEGKSAAVVTDLGNYNQYIVNHLQGLDSMVIEANHDIRMLETGPYPYYLKRRILGDYGHLSNERSGQLLCELLHDRIKGIFLGHLSKENNMAELAYETVKLEITMGDNEYKGNDFNIEVAPRDRLSRVFEF